MTARVANARAQRQNKTDQTYQVEMPNAAGGPAWPERGRQGGFVLATTKWPTEALAHDAWAVRAGLRGASTEALAHVRSWVGLTGRAGQGGVPT